MQIIFESCKQERATEFTLYLVSLDSDSESLEIPKTSFQSEISMISNDFERLCRELYSLSETITFEISNGAVKFSFEGEVGAGSISIKTTEE